MIQVLVRLLAWQIVLVFAFFLETHHKDLPYRLMSNAVQYGIGKSLAFADNDETYKWEILMENIISADKVVLKQGVFLFIYNPMTGWRT
jgi:hypothetical protein